MSKEKWGYPGIVCVRIPKWSAMEDLVQIGVDAQSGSLGSITVINDETNSTATLTDPQSANPSAVAVNSDANKIYVANSGSNNVTMIDGAMTDSTIALSQPYGGAHQFPTPEVNCRNRR